MDWIVWNTSYLQQFFSTVKQAIGSSVNVGIVVFGIVMSIMVVTVVVRIFAYGGRR